MAEFIMKSKTDEYYIESAATSTEEIGNGIYPPACEQLIKHGIGGFKEKTARQVRKSDYDEFDYLIIMDEENRRGLERIVGKDPDNKIFKMLDFFDDESLKGQDVADPWYTRDFNKSFEEIEKGCEGLLRFIRRKG